jgi:hypothetical protein
MSAFRNAYRPANIREDLAYLPQLLRNRSVLLPAALTIVSVILVGRLGAAVTGATDGAAEPDFVAGVALYLFLVPPPPGGAFLAGILAPRASYLSGFIVGLLAGGGYLIALMLLPGIAVATADDRMSITLQAIVLSPMACMFYAAAAAWYRRFLSLSSTRRRPPTKPAGRGQLVPKRR